MLKSNITKPRQCVAKRVSIIAGEHRGRTGICMGYFGHIRGRTGWYEGNCFILGVGSIQINLNSLYVIKL